MRIKPKRIAQSLLEYTILFAVLGGALSAMSIYSRRAIQAGVKVSADELGEQRKGGLEYDFRFDWKVKGDTRTNSATSETTTITKKPGGEVTDVSDTTTKRWGELSHDIFREGKNK